MPLPPKFAFQERQGRLAWRQIMNVNLETVRSEVDLRQLEGLLQNLTYAEFDREDIEKVGDANVVKLFRVAQMSIEYLIYTQNYLETLTKSLDAHYKHVYEGEARVKDKAKAQASECAQLKRDLALKSKTLSTYEYLLKLPAQHDS